MGPSAEKQEESFLPYAHPQKDAHRKHLPRALALGALALFLLTYIPTGCHQAIRTYLAPVPKGPIDWKECGKGFECGRIEVPMDYKNTSAGTVSIAVGRYLATAKDKKGSVFINPGGPGGSGMSYLYRGAPTLSQILDGVYDIVSWDPRGINGTTPRVECFPDAFSQDIFDLSYSTSIEASLFNFTSSSSQESIRSQLRLIYAEDKLRAALCEKQTGMEPLQHMGTATVVRDLVTLADVIVGKNEPINYWGLSYGTVIGAYFVNMFPERTGKVIVDGVVDPVHWAEMPEYQWGKYVFQDTDKVFENFLFACIQAGPTRCALASHAGTPSSLRSKIFEAIEHLHNSPMTVTDPQAERPGLIRSYDVKDRIFSAMYRPRDWPKLAKELSGFLAGNGTLILNAITPSISTNSSDVQATAAANSVVICTDGPPLASELASKKVSDDDVIEMILQGGMETWEEASKLFAINSFTSTCWHWKVRERERFVGPFNSTDVKGDVLVIGNTADPVTPLANAKTVNRLLPESSRLLIQDGAGHCSVSQVSLCTGKVVREFFLDDKLPENGKVCPVTEVLFPEPKSNATTALWSLGDADEVEVLSTEDLLLLERMKKWGEIAQEGVSGFRRRVSGLQI